MCERHAADQKYPVGTVVKVGGSEEITSVEQTDEDNVLGVVSNTYAYLLNATAGNDETHPPIALLGRVVVRVVGPIRKGDLITSYGGGCAIVSENGRGFGWALEDSSDEHEKLVLCVIK